MSERFNFSKLLSKTEQRLLERPEAWRWVSSMTTPDIRPVRNAEHLEWAKTNCHAPAQRELFLTLSGHTTFVLQDKVYKISPGVVMMFNSRERHDKELFPQSRGFRHLWLHLSNRHAVDSNLHEVDAAGERTDTPLKIMTGHNPQLMIELWDQYGSKDSFSPVHWAFLKSLIAASFFEALSDWSNPVTTHSHQLVVDSICDYIHKNLDKELTLEFLAQLAGYSPYFFHRLFLRYAKKPLHRYIIEARLERAKELLETGQSVNAVSEQVGMVSASYFSRFFKKHTRFCPTMWREVHLVQK